jgi:hypothetical protein
MSGGIGAGAISRLASGVASGLGVISVARVGAATAKSKRSGMSAATILHISTPQSFCE